MTAIFGPFKKAMQKTLFNQTPNSPTHYYAEYVRGLGRPGVIPLEQIRTIAKRQIGICFGRMMNQQMDEISEMLKASLGLYIPEEIETP